MRTPKSPSVAPDLAPATISELDGVRYLHLGTPWVQGAMRIRKPHVLELEYIRRMMAWMLLRSEEALTQGHAVQLGLGSASITRFCHHTLGMHTTAVEINPSVISACRMFFHLPPDQSQSPKLQVLELDAADYLADAAHVARVDALQVDLYDHDAAGPVLDDSAFYQACHRLLRPGGVVSINLFGRDASFTRSLQHVVAAFGAPQVRSMTPTKEGNTMVLALKDSDFPDANTLALRAKNIETRFGLSASPWLRMLRAVPTTTP
jgi:spermidine synthase